MVSPTGHAFPRKITHVGCLNSGQATGNSPLTYVTIGERNVYQDLLDPECASISQLEANDPEVLPSQRKAPEDQEVFTL